MKLLLSKIWVWTFKSSLYLAKLNSFGEFVMYLIIIYGGHVGFRVLVVDGSISLSYMRSLSNTIFFTNNLITLEYIFIGIIHTIQKMFQLPSTRYIDYDACLIIERCN